MNVPGEWINASGDTVTHAFAPAVVDDFFCKHCDGYPFDLVHWNPT